MSPSTSTTGPGPRPTWARAGAVGRGRPPADAPDRVVLLDLDGTLLDTASLVVTGLQAALDEVTGRRPSAEEVRRQFGRPQPEMIAALAGTTRDDPLVDRIRVCYRDYYVDVVRPRVACSTYPGVPEQLRRLAGHRVGCVALTTKVRRCAEAILDASGLAPYVQLVVAADDTARALPSPQHAHRALRLLRWQGPPGRVVVVGDSVTAIAMGRKAHLRTVAVTYGRSSPAELAAVWPDVLAATFPDAISAALDLTDRSEAR